MDRSSLRPALLALGIAACGAPSKPKAPPPLPSAKAPATPSAQPNEHPPDRLDPVVGPHGETALLAGHRVKIASPSGSETIIEPTELHPPPGDRGLRGISPTALLFLDDGTLLVGEGDGTVTALDAAGHRRYSLGFRGAIRGLVPAGEEGIAVTTQRGVMALMTREGLLRWERQITAERLGPAVITKANADPRPTLKGPMILAASQRGVFALSPRGELVFSHASHLLRRECEDEEERCEKEEEFPALSLAGEEVIAGPGLRFRLDAPHPAVPSLAPIFPLTFRRVLDGSVSSLLSTGPTELSALVTHRKDRSEYDWGEDDKFEVVRIEGSRMTRVPVPDRASRKEVFVEGTKPARAPLFIDALVAGPGGIPWILGRRFNSERTTSGDGIMGRFGGAGQILELRGGAIRERNDLFSALSAHYLSDRIAAAPQGPANLLCFGYEKPVCAAHDGSSARLIEAPGRVTAVRRIGDSAWLLTHKGEIFRSDRDGKGFVAVPRPDKAFVSGIGGPSERDVWADFKQRYTVLHFDGARWTEVPVPTSVHGFSRRYAFVGSDVTYVAVAASAHGFSARAADDVWIGRLYWNGTQWSIVYGAPAATSVLAKGRDDLWLGDASGLWHGTAPGPAPVRLPQAPPSPDEGAIRAVLPSPLDAPETRYVVERTSLEVAGDAPLTTARNVSASADGVLWMQTWDRVIEVDGSGKATTLRRGGRDSFGRWAYPEAQGRGTLLNHDEVQRLSGGGATREDVQLDHHDVMAVHGAERGSTWVVGTSPLVTPSSYEDLRALGVSTWDEFSPHALVRAGSEGGFRPVFGLPSASWCDVAATPDGGAWFAGGLSEGPAGEGILFHARGRLGSEATSRFRAPASLLAVTAVGSDDAWAVGAAGTVIHVHGGAVTRVALASGEWLRSVLGVGPDDVWIGGDGGTLLHYDGHGFHPVDHPLGAHATLTGIAFARGALWVVGPSGILRVTKRP